MDFSLLHKYLGVAVEGTWLDRLTKPFSTSNGRNILHECDERNHQIWFTKGGSDFMAHTASHQRFLGAVEIWR